MLAIHLGFLRFFVALAVLNLSLVCCFSQSNGSKSYDPEFAFELHSERVGQFSEGLARLNNDYVNKKGEVVLKHGGKWNALGNFSDGMAKVHDYGGCGYINKRGQLEVPCDFPDGGEFSEGLVQVKFENYDPEVTDVDCLWGFINKRGETVIPPKFERVLFGFSDGLAVVLDSNKLAKFIDKTGRVVLAPENARVCLPFLEGLARVVIGERDDHNNWKSGFINRQGDFVIQPQDSWVGCFFEGLTRVETADKFGFMNQSGQMAIPQRWKQAYPFQHGRALVQNDDDKWGIIDSEGNVVQEPIWDKVGATKICGVRNAFSEGMASVHCDGSWRHIDTNGNVANGVWDDSSLSMDGMIWVKKDGKEGFIRNPFYRPTTREAKRSGLSR